MKTLVSKSRNHDKSLVSPASKSAEGKKLAAFLITPNEDSAKKFDIQLVSCVISPSKDSQSQSFEKSLKRANTADKSLNYSSKNKQFEEKLDNILQIKPKTP